MSAFAWATDFKEIEGFSKRHQSSLEYVESTKKFLSTMLCVSESTISETPPNDCIHQSEEHYKKTAQGADAWLGFVTNSSPLSRSALTLSSSYYVVLLPCVLVRRTSFRTGVSVLTNST